MDKFAEFWAWFAANQAAYRDFATPDQRVEKDFDRLAQALGKVNGDLTFEFGPPGDVRDFVISAGGLKKSFFPMSLALAKAAPPLPRWRIVAFRPRRSTLNIVEFQGVTLNPAETYYSLVRGTQNIGIILYNRKYSADRKREWGNALYLLLDEILGEHDMETKVGMIEFATPDDAKLGQYFDAGNPVGKMAAHFDEAWQRLKGK